MKVFNILLIMFLMPLGLIPSAAQEITTFEPTPCPVTYASRYRVECGYLVVPEEHNNPDGATIRLMVAIFRTDDNRRQPDPIVYLSGGPGARTLDSFAGGLGNFLEIQLRDRDVILIDQRGMGYSEPSLNCTEIDTLSLREEQGPYAADVIQAMEPMRECFARLTDEGVNIAAYNTVESAADVAAIAPALGYDEYNIYGGSYGSTLAMTVMRNHPERLRTVFLVGITPPQVDLMASFAPNLEHALNLLFETCAADVLCGTAFPNLEDTFYTTVEQLNADPLQITVTNPLNDTPTTYTLDGNDFVRGVQMAMYDWWTLPQIPIFITGVSVRDTSALEPIITSALTRNMGSSEGAHFAMRCMDDVMTTTPEIWESTVASVNPGLQSAFRQDISDWAALCAQWGVRQLDPIENTPVVSDIPTLIMNGAFDPVTPALWGALAVETLPNGYNYNFATSAHGIEPSSCAVGIYSEFINDPTHAPSSECIESLSPLQFVVP